ncbi:diadenosine tetraphosphate hydrolase [Candidatus Woesearchaeota archaeon]|nr:diadenosine tetraphosphate hydrolase [Candidatus Woesearchaeota archaeon]
MTSGEIDFSRAEIKVTKHFNAHQDYETPIPGFIIVASKRHVLSLSEFSDAEQKEFIRLIRALREGMRQTLKVKYVYLFQNEDTKHHFHLWMFPRLGWMDRFGKGINSVEPIVKYAQKNMKTKDNLKKIEESVKKMRVYMEKVIMG